MASLTHKLICSFCCATFAPHDIRFRCTATDCLGRTQDILYSRVVGGRPTVMGRVLVPPKKRPLQRGFPRQVTCDVCQHPTTTRICPECHFELPADIGQTDQYFIALLGSPASGKTHYLAALISHLQYDVGPRLKMTIRPLGEHAQARWDRQYAALFEKKTLLPETKSADIDPQSQYPLVFRLTIDQHGAKKIINFGFFDASGADMVPGEGSKVMRRYLRQAHGVLYFLDPLTIDGARQSIGARAPQVSPVLSTEQVPLFLRDLFEAEQLVRPAEKVKLPIAFILSKIDLLQSALDPGSPLLRPASPYGSVSLQQLQSVSTEVTALLTSWLGPHVSTAIRNEFATYAYFGVSALGGSADAQKRLIAISSLRVEDPFLWLLLQLHVLKEEKQ